VSEEKSVVAADCIPKHDFSVKIQSLFTFRTVFSV